MAVTINGSSGITANDGSVFTNAQGNVGIGTSSPTAKLDVVGNIAASGTVTLSGGTANGVAYLNSSNVLTTGSALTFNGLKLNNSSGAAAGIIQSTDTAGSGNFVRILGDATFGSLINFSTGSSLRFATSADNFGSFSERMRLDAAGNLGLGAVPSSWIGVGKAIEIGDVGTGIWGRKKISDYVTNTYFSATGYRYAKNGGAGRYTVNENNHSWHVAASGTAGNAISFTQAMTLDASGNLLVGATSLNAQGKQEITFNGSTNQGLNVIDDSAAAAATAISFIKSSGTRGSITVTASATAYNTSSDYRLKENIQPMTGALAKVAALKPVTYKWKADGSDGQGFIAHELQEVVPQCVTGEKDAVDAESNPVYQGIDTSFLVAILAAAIQEQQAIIQSLQARLDAAGL